MPLPGNLCRCRRSCSVGCRLENAAASLLMTPIATPCPNVFDTSLASLLPPVVRRALKESLALMAGSAKATQYARKKCAQKSFTTGRSFLRARSTPSFFERRSELSRCAKQQNWIQRRHSEPADRNYLNPQSSKLPAGSEQSEKTPRTIESRPPFVLFGTGVLVVAASTVAHWRCPSEFPTIK